MVKISACLIAKNEEARIGACLESIKDIVDEIIVVDTGSTDKTKEIASKYAKVFDFVWVNDFSLARNYSFDKATGDWIIWLDCDDIFKPEDVAKFKVLKESRLMTTTVDVFAFWYCYRHDEDGNCTYKFKRDRLLRNNKGFHWEYPIHELLLVNRNVEDIDICVTHTSNHDNGEKYIKFFEDKINNEGYELKQRDMYYYGGELAIFGHTDKAQEIFERFFSIGEHDNQYEAKRAADYLYEIYLKKGMYLEALETEFKYLKYGYPDPKIFHKMGYTFTMLDKIDEAIFYHKIAVDMREEFPKETCIVNEYNYFVFCSSLELVCLLYRKNRLDEAKRYHLIAKELNPTHNSVIYNEQFF